MRKITLVSWFVSETTGGACKEGTFEELFALLVLYHGGVVRAQLKAFFLCDITRTPEERAPGDSRNGRSHFNHQRHLEHIQITPRPASQNIGQQGKVQATLQSVEGHDGDAEKNGG